MTPRKAKSSTAATTNKSPAYQWYPRDFLTDPPVRLMDWEARALYRELLDYQWLAGSVPDDSAAVSKAADFPLDVVERVWQQVKPQFPGGKNRRMERQRADLMAFKKNRQEMGRIGGKKAQARLRSASSSAKAKLELSSSPASASASVLQVQQKQMQKPAPLPATAAPMGGSPSLDESAVKLAAIKARIEAEERAAMPKPRWAK